MNYHFESLLKPHRQHTMTKLLMYKDTESNEFTCMMYCRQIIRSLQISPLETLVHEASTISATIQFTFPPQLVTLRHTFKINCLFCY
jgi:hypothetical protein